jgi:hypothetical protein
MTIEQLRRVHQATPFEPFSLYMADGRSYEIPHRDFLSPSPTGRTVVVHHADDSASILDLLLINEIRLHRPKSAPQNGEG